MDLVRYAGFFKFECEQTTPSDFKMANIDKKVSFHTARHTNATLLLYNGANITTVQKLLGHKSVRTTEIYSNIMDMTVVRDLSSLSNIK